MFKSGLPKLVELIVVQRDHRDLEATSGNAIARNLVCVESTEDPSRLHPEWYEASWKNVDERSNPEFKPPVLIFVDAFTLVNAAKLEK